jgi:branched-chain amino acid transport system permease protein
MKTASSPSTRELWNVRLLRSAPYIIVAIIFVILPPVSPTYIQSVMTKVLIFAIFAASLNIIMGYTGMLSLGHAAFFGVGGYTVGIFITKCGIESFWIILPCAILITAITASILGVIALRTSGIYFLLVTFALSMLLFSIAVKWYSLTQGMDGLPGLPRPILGLPGFRWDTTSFYFFVLLASAICFYLMYCIINSPFGLVLRGIREAEPRMRALGFNPWLYKYIAFIISGAFAGIAGMLFAYHNGYASPVNLGVLYSGLVMLICIIGGLGTLLGPVVGALVIILVEYFSSLYVPERWPLILGGIFILAVILLRGGIVPYLSRLSKRIGLGSIKSRTII